MKSFLRNLFARKTAAKAPAFRPAVESLEGRSLMAALGGIIVAHEVGRLLQARVLFAERQDGKMSLRRGFHISPGEKVLVCEDVITTGGSVREVIDLAREAGGEVVGGPPMGVERAQFVVG